MDRQPVAGVLSWEVFGQKHSDVSFTYWRTVLVIKNKKKLISPHLERQVFVSNFQAMLLSRTAQAGPRAQNIQPLRGQTDLGKKLQNWPMTIFSPPL